MTVTERLLKDTESIWAEYHQHPFVQGIADGTLDKEKFKYYMIQDYLYLLDYTKVFAIGVAKAKDMEFMKRFANSTHAILDGEMDIHRAYMARLGITPEETETPASTEDKESDDKQSQKTSGKNVKADSGMKNPVIWISGIGIIVIIILLIYFLKKKK